MAEPLAAVLGDDVEPFESTEVKQFTEDGSPPPSPTKRDGSPTRVEMEAPMKELEPAKDPAKEPAKAPPEPKQMTDEPPSGAVTKPKGLENYFGMPFKPLQMICWTIQHGGAEEMMSVGRRARLRAGEGTVVFIPPELYTLGWAATAFGSRVEAIMDAQTIDVDRVFANTDEELEPACTCYGPFHMGTAARVAPKPPGWLTTEHEPEMTDLELLLGVRLYIPGMGSGGLYWEWLNEPDPARRRELAGPKRFRMTNASVDRVQKALRDALKRGNGESLLAIGERVAVEWAIGYKNVPDLHALTWACRVLGERCANGDFGSRITPEEAAFLAKLTDIVKRVHLLEAGETRTGIAAWAPQLAAALKELHEAPASDGEEEAFGARAHLRELKRLEPLLRADDEGLEKIAAVDAMPITSPAMLTQLEAWSLGDAETAGELAIDLEPIHALEVAVKAASKQFASGLPALFVPDAEKLLARRSVERDLIEGVKERNSGGLASALAAVEASPDLGVAVELVPYAKKTIAKLVLDEDLDAAVAERARSKVADVLARVALPDAPVADATLVTAAKALLAKLDLFGECEVAMGASDVESLKAKIHEATHGWWHAEHWHAADKKQLHTYQIALKRLTVLAQIQEHMEPLSAAKLQAAVDVAQEVHLSDPLVDQAIEILSKLDRETRVGEFTKPYAAGGAYSADGAWLANPQWQITFPAEAESKTCKLSITMIEGGGDGDEGGDYFEDFAVHVVQNAAGSNAEEVALGHAVVAQTEYDAETSILTIDALPTADGVKYYIVPSAKVADEVGPFKINVICETPGVNMDLHAVVKTGDLVLEAIAKDDLGELERLMNHAKEKNLTRVHGVKGMKYLTRRKKENTLKKACADADPDGSGEIDADEFAGHEGGVDALVAAFQEGLDGAAAANVPPSLVDKASNLLAQLLTVPMMIKASDAKDWQALDSAIHKAKEAKVSENTIAPYMRQMLMLRAEARLRACLAKGEDGYPELQACYDAALAAELTGEDVAEAKRILEALKDAQRSFHAAFEKWHGGSVDNTLWADNPQFKLTTGSTPPPSVSVSLDRDGEAEYEEYAVHVVSVPAGGEQVGEAYTVVVASEYDSETALVKFEATADATYFLVCSTKNPHMTGGFALTTIGVGSYNLEPVSLLQQTLKGTMAKKAFEELPALIATAEGATANIPHHPVVVQAKLIGDIEKGWQAKDAEAMGTALSNAKKEKVDKTVLKTYFQRYKQLAMAIKLQKGLEGDPGLLLAAVEEAKLIEFTGDKWAEAEAAYKKFKFHTSLAATFLDDNAAGARKFGSWRDNPTWKLTAAAKTMIYIAVNEDGKLDGATEKKLDAKKKKAEEAYEKARDKMAATAAAAEADEKNDELAAAAKDAARVFGELDEKKKAKQAKEDEGEEDAFTALGVHVVKNSRESWIPGVLSGYEDLAGCLEYGDDQAYLGFEYDPAMGPVYVVPSTFEPGEEGVFTLSLMANAELTLEEVEEFEGNCYKLKGSWSTKNEGPRSKKNGDKENGKNFKPEKTWNKNPQFRVWLRDPDSGDQVDATSLSIVLSTPIEGAEMGMHIMRNAFCQFYNEKIEVLADRYQKLVGKTDKHVAAEEGKAPEISFEIQLESSFEVKKNGCEENFPFFIVPSLFDKKMDGPFSLQIYSEKAIVIQMLDDGARKL